MENKSENSINAAALADTLQITRKEFVSDSGSLKISIAYPEINGLKDSTYQKEINNRIMEIFLSPVNESDDDLDEEGEIKTNYSVYFNKHGILSIGYNTYEYYSEASRPWSNYYSLNINLKSGKELLLEDLIIKNQLEKITGILNRQEDSINHTGRRFTVSSKDLNTFCIAKDGLIFYLKGSSEVEGTQDFKIPFTAINESLDKEFAEKVK